MASGPKTRARVLTIQHPGFSDTLEAVVKRSFSEARKRKNKLEPSIFEGANSPLAVFESTEAPKMRREIELRKSYRSPPGSFRPALRPPQKGPAMPQRNFAEKTAGRNETVVYKTPRTGGETVVYKTPRGGGETIVYKTPEAKKADMPGAVTPKPVAPKPMVISPKSRPAAVKNRPKRQRFNDAFATAKKQGKRNFVFEGKRYTTKTK